VGSARCGRFRIPSFERVSSTRQIFENGRRSALGPRILSGAAPLPGARTKNVTPKTALFQYCDVRATAAFGGDAESACARRARTNRLTSFTSARCRADKNHYAEASLLLLVVIAVRDTADQSLPRAQSPRRRQ
jgi:hypothetical protein